MNPVRKPPDVKELKILFSLRKSGRNFSGRIAIRPRFG